MIKCKILKVTAKLKCSCYKIANRFWPKGRSSQPLNLSARTQSVRMGGSIIRHLLRSCLGHFSTSILLRIKLEINLSSRARSAKKLTTQSIAKMLKVTKMCWFGAKNAVKPNANSVWLKIIKFPRGTVWYRG